MRHLLDPDEWALERGEIFALFTELGVKGEDERHRLQHAVTGCSSLRFMTHEEHHKLIETLGHLAEKPREEQRRVLKGLLALSSFDYRDAD